MNVTNVKVDRCPFCGGKSRVHKYFSKYYARCNKCNSYSAPYDTPEQAAAAWNKRAYAIGVDLEQSPKKNDRACCMKCDYATFDEIAGRLFCCRWNSYNPHDDWCCKFIPRKEGD